jgi:Transcriptional regulator, AbiEi antitoxin
MDTRLEHLARQRGGYFTRVEAKDCGYGDRDIQAAVRAGEWRRPRRGYYAPAAQYDALDGAGQHLLLCQIVQDRLGDRVAITHQSASCAWRHDQWGWDMSVVNLTRLDGGAGRLEAGIRHHETRIDESELVKVHGLWVPAEPRTVFEACTDVSVESGLCIASSALRIGRVTEDMLDDYSQSQRARVWPGSRNARLAIQLSDGRLQSTGESRSLYMLWRHALPPPELQYEMRSRDGRLLGYNDFAWPTYCHLGEFDGKRKYTRDIKPGEDPGEVVFREKRREDEMRREGAGMSRWIWVELEPGRQLTTARRIDNELRESARLYGRNRTIIV